MLISVWPAIRQGAKSPGMAEQRRRGLGSPEWTELPGTALELIVKALPVKGDCLRTSRQLRDAVLAASTSISLTILGNEPSQAEHQPLLRRACSTAAPGLKLVLHGDKCAWKRTSKVLAELLQPFTSEGSKLANVHHLGLEGWSNYQALGSSTLSVAPAFPNLTTLHLEECVLEDGAFLTSLLLCRSLHNLHIIKCNLKTAAIAALPILQQLQPLRHLQWLEIEDCPREIREQVQAQLSHLTQLTSVTLNWPMSQLSYHISVAAHMTQLTSISLPVVLYNPFESPPAAQAEGFMGLTSASLSQLLASCSLLTTLSMEGIVVDHAGLDLLLAHPHIVHITVLAIAATESRVDSPCSWQTLQLPHQMDVRTLAYVPLHSLKEPLPVGLVLLPPDVPSEDAPKLLRTALTRMAEQPHLFDHADASETLVICTSVLNPASGQFTSGAYNRQWSRESTQALLSALEPYSEAYGLEELILDLDSSRGDLPAVMVVGEQELLALDKACGSSLSILQLEGISLAHDFFPAVIKTLPVLGELRFGVVNPNGPTLAARLMHLVHKMPRPLRVEVDDDAYEVCCTLMEELELYGGEPSHIFIGRIDDE